MYQTEALKIDDLNRVWEAWPCTFNRMLVFPHRASHENTI
jgi:hypothetical protein